MFEDDWVALRGSQRIFLPYLYRFVTLGTNQTSARAIESEAEDRRL